MSITPAHMQLLTDRAITPDVAEASGIESTPKGIRFPWSDGVGATVWQSRPDNPPVDEDGRAMKYLFPKGAKTPLNRLRDGETYDRMIIAEGTCQSYAVLSHAPAEFAVYGLAGCWGWKHADLTVAKGRSVFLLLDADMATNLDVWVAAEAFAKQLTKHGAKGVRFVSTTGTGKDGVDDVLAGFKSDEQRADMLKLWLSQATDKMGRRPKAKQPTDGASQFFRVRKDPVVLQPASMATVLLEQYPAAITAEGNIALYDNGVYRVDADAILSVVVQMLEDYYTPSHLKTVTDVVKGLLKQRNLKLDDHAPDALLNCPNGMVDLRTGALLPHDAKYMSTIQVMTDYDADAACPTYEAWLREALRQEGATEDDVERLMADIEEVAGTMLDPSKTPSKALFLFGPSRSGKSTFLRLLKAIAGAANTSAVTLHDLANDQFARANLYGKMLNVAADLSSKHVDDLSNFKMITGEDVVNGNRKYGQQFAFTNQSLVAFSANELPTVSEASRAYAERMKPFNFPNSFAGREDKTLEDKLLAELPGILNRWIKAYQRYLARGGYASTDAATQSMFEAKSDRVVQFVQDMCELTPAGHGQQLDPSLCTGRRDVAFAFNAWAERNGGSKMGERAIFARLASIEGVTEVRKGRNSRAFNMVVRQADEDNWGSDEPVADPIEPSGVSVDDVPRLDAGNPWMAPESAGTPCPVPAATASVNEPQTAAQQDAEALADLMAAKGATLDPFVTGFELDYEV